MYAKYKIRGLDIDRQKFPSKTSDIRIILLFEPVHGALIAIAVVLVAGERLKEGATYLFKRYYRCLYVASTKERDDIQRVEMPCERCQY